MSVMDGMDCIIVLKWIVLIMIFWLNCYLSFLEKFNGCEIK